MNTVCKNLNKEPLTKTKNLFCFSKIYKNKKISKNNICSVLTRFLCTTSLCTYTSLDNAFASRVRAAANSDTELAIAETA